MRACHVSEVTCVRSAVQAASPSAGGGHRPAVPVADHQTVSQQRWLSGTIQHVTTAGTVRFWQDDDGWGVIDSEQTPSGCWAHFSVVAIDGYKTLEPGQAVVLEWEPGQQDGFSYRALRTWPADRAPAVTQVTPPATPQAYSSTLTITYDGDR